MIKLNPYEKFYLDQQFFLVKTGKIITKDILPNGKIISNENCLKEGDIIGNFFNFLECEALNIPNIDIEIEALEETTLEKLDRFQLTALNNSIFEKVLLHLIKKTTIKFLHHLYGNKGYILVILKLYSDQNGKISKKEINHENFNISKSQFYLLYSKLKQENFFVENKKEIILDIKKINSFLNLFEFH